MFGLGGDDENSQRLWNMLLFKMPLTDAEIEEAMPFIGIILLIIVIIVVVMVIV